MAPLSLWGDGAGGMRFRLARLTVVYQLCDDVRRLLYVGKGREIESLSTFFEERGAALCGGIAHVCSEMWRVNLHVNKLKKGKKFPRRLFKKTD
jgi:hypothetical protein